MQLPFSTHLFQYHAGSQIGNNSFIWKIPENEVREGTEVGSGKSKASFAFIFNTSHEKKLLQIDMPMLQISVLLFLRVMHDNRWEIMLDDPGVDIIVDRRAVNAGRPEQLTAFWTELDKVLEEYGKAVDDQRHGPDVAHICLLQ